MAKQGVQLLWGTCLTEDGNCAPGAEPEVEKHVEERIKDQEVIIFSKSYCPFCNKVKGLLDESGVKYTVVELDQHKKGEQIQSHLLELTGQRTVPNVFVKGMHIGGASDTIEEWNAGELQKLIKSG